MHKLQISPNRLVRLSDLVGCVSWSIVFRRCDAYVFIWHAKAKEPTYTLYNGTVDCGVLQSAI